MPDRLIDILTFAAGYNTAVVVIGAALLGAAAGIVGVFTLLRKRALVSDAISHATLPGVGAGFLVALALGTDPRSLPVLLAGAAVTGAMGAFAVQMIRDHTRLPEDAAIGTVLSVFFGVGVVLLSHIQTLSSGSQAGLDSFLLGQTAALSRTEAELIAGAAGLVTVAVIFLIKELTILSFDADFAAAQGWPTARLDLLLMALLLTVVAIGLKTVGLVLIVALVIIPPVAARFWTDRLSRMVLAAALFGAVSGYLGATLSALLPDLPAGPVIVLTAGALFAVSLLLAPRRGILIQAVRQWRFARAVRYRQALAALDEGGLPAGRAARRRLVREGLILPSGEPTDAGRRAGAEAAREQALWDRYIMGAGGGAAADIDWSAARIEDALPGDVLAELRRDASSIRAVEKAR